MSAGLREYPFACIDQYDGDIRARGAGRHVTRVLFVARCVRHDEGAPGSREESVRDIDRDALLTLRLQAVDQQSEVEIVSSRAVLGAVARERHELIVQDQLAVVEQAANQ